MINKKIDEYLNKYINENDEYGLRKFTKKIEAQCIKYYGKDNVRFEDLCEDEDPEYYSDKLEFEVVLFKKYTLRFKHFPGPSNSTRYFEFVYNNKDYSKYAHDKGFGEFTSGEEFIKAFNIFLLSHI